MNKMLTTSPIMNFPVSADIISIGTSSILSKYSSWYETLETISFNSKKDFFHYFEVRFIGISDTKTPKIQPVSCLNLNPDREFINYLVDSPVVRQS